MSSPRNPVLAVFAVFVVAASIRIAEAEPEVTSIRVIRTQAIEKEDDQVSAAYRAYQAGDLAVARTRYTEVLQAHPDNRDALLGLAACAVKTGDDEAATALYSRLVRVNPQDTLSRAALIGLQRKQGDRQEEAAIREFLVDQPDNPFLYFTLGKLQASQLRWPEAKQAFLEAHRIDSANPVYVLNLAISLDRMGQGKAARDYYLSAVELAERNAAGLDMGPVIKRINSLFLTPLP